MLVDYNWSLMTQINGDTLPPEFPESVPFYLSSGSWCLRDSPAQRYINPRRIWRRRRGLRPLSRWPWVRSHRCLRIFPLGLPSNGKGLILYLQFGGVAVARALFIEFHTARAGR
jgi:hypothetical protein